MQKSRAERLFPFIKPIFCGQTPKEEVLSIIFVGLKKQKVPA